MAQVVIRTDEEEIVMKVQCGVLHGYEFLYSLILLLFGILLMKRL